MRVGVSTMIQSPNDVEFVIECERLGVDTVWVPEVWGYDATTPLGLLAGKTSSIRLATGIVQLGARTPAMLAMQSMSLQMMSGGRFILGVGSSGPRIMEGWHGVPFSKPVQLTRETIDIVRMIARGDRLQYEGELFQLPPDGFGRSIRSLAPACEPIPMYVASLGPRNLELTGEIADGWLGNAMMPEAAEAFLEPLRVGCERGGRSLTDLDLVMPVAVEFTDDVEEASR
ncbi:MAG: LLM class flavin-dependent oxidoreductase, partial [Actinomycetota bacterium]|nr:LLM class flavin-dependent oxidoreductase [Actinomycetota bacterium]